MEHHWKSQFHQCRICNNDYQYITHLENISNEAEYIFQQLKIGEDLISTTIKIVFNRHYFLFISGTLGEITSFAGNFDYNFSWFGRMLNCVCFKFSELKKENITHIMGRYSWSPAGKDELRWQSIPRGTAIKIYKHYFADFGKFWMLKWNIYFFVSVLFGYSPDDVEGFIAASNKSASPPSKELDEQSRKQLKSFKKEYEKYQEDFICWNQTHIWSSS